MSDNNTIWSLRITLKNGANQEIFGFERYLKGKLQEWENPEVTKHTLIIKGFCNSYDRAPHWVYISIEEIAMISLVEMYKE